MATGADQGHRFGGAWTELKLDAVHYYLGFFTRVLRTQPFDLWYIDAFAGSGTRTIERETGGLLENAPVTEVTEELAGSVLRALSVDPPFARLKAMYHASGSSKSFGRDDRRSGLNAGTATPISNSGRSSNSSPGAARSAAVGGCVQWCSSIPTA
jgi:hypothetical protein